MLSDEQRSKIAKRSSAKGGEYERRVAKLIASWHGILWTDAFLRTRRTTGGQPKGDLVPIGDMHLLWHGAGLGPIEAKNRKEWAFNEVFKNSERCRLMQYWQKSNEDCSSLNSLVFFSKPGVTDFVLGADINTQGPIITFKAFDRIFTIQTTINFLQSYWPRNDIQPAMVFEEQDASSTEAT